MGSHAKARLAGLGLVTAALSLPASGCHAPGLVFLMYQGTVNVTIQGTPAPAEGAEVSATARGLDAVTSSTDNVGHFSGRLGPLEAGDRVFFTFDRDPDDDLGPSLGAVTSVPSPVGGDSQISIEANLDQGTFQSLPAESAAFTVAISDPTDGGSVHCSSPPALCLFDVEGASTGLFSSLSTAEQFRLYVLVFPLDPFGGGWFLQRTPATVSQVDGSWLAVAQLGNQTSQPESGDTLRLVAVIAKKADVDQFIASRPDPNQPVPTLQPGDFPLHVESAIVDVTVER